MVPACAGTTPVFYYNDGVIISLIRRDGAES